MTAPGGDQHGGTLARRIGLAGGSLAFLAILFLPSGLDAQQRRVAATTALTACLWITVAVPVAAASLVPAVLFPLLGVVPASVAAPAYMHDLVMLFLGAFVIALGLERWGVHRRIALFIIEHLGTSLRTLVLGFMAAAAFLSMWINNTATTLLMLPIAMAVVARVDESEGENGRFAACLLLGVAYSASAGGMGTPVGTAPNQVFLGQFALRFPEGPKLTFSDWALAWMPLVVLFVPCVWFLLTRFVHPIGGGGGGSGGAGAADLIREERRAQGPMDAPQVRMSLVFAATGLLWVTRADIALGDWRLPGWSRLFLGPDAADPAWYAAHKNDLSDSTVAILMALACFVLPAGGGRRGPLMNWPTAARLPWEVLLLLGGGFCIAEGFEISGLDHVLGAGMSGLFEGRSSWVIVAGVTLFVSLLTELTSNTATTAVLLPVIAGAGVAAGVHPLLVMAPATIAASAAFMMPVATPPNAVVFSSRRVSVPTMARTGVWVNLLVVVLVTLVFQLWVRRVWNIGAGLPEWAAP